MLALVCGTAIVATGVLLVFVLVLSGGPFERRYWLGAALRKSP
jgi:hypothetical protein